MKRAGFVHDVTDSQTARHEMAALTAVFETFEGRILTNFIINRPKTAVIFPILINMARDATSLRSHLKADQVCGSSRHSKKTYKSRSRE